MTTASSSASQLQQRLPEEKPWPQLSGSNADAQTFKCKYVTNHNSLGDGNFSVVKECMNIHTKDLYAMKLIKKQTVKNKIQLIQREFDLLRSISEKIRDMEKKNEHSLDIFEGHHHILQLFDYFETADNIVLITQLCQKGDLYEKIVENQCLDLEAQVTSYCACLVSVLEFLHSQGIVHRDLKAENVLFRLRVNENEKNLQGEHHGDFKYDLLAHDLVLADFGLAAEYNTSKVNSLKEFVGTISYIAPEIVKCKGVGEMTPDQVGKLDKYGCPVDIWALGVLTYFMAFGYTPFDCTTDDETLECISKCDYYVDEQMMHDPKYEQFWNFVQCCFTIDPAVRRSAKNLKQHPFIKDYFATSNSLNTKDTPNFSFHPTIRRVSSTASMHTLRSPSKSRKTTTLAYLNMDGGSSETSTAFSSKMDLPDLYVDRTINSRERSLNRIRDTLKKTLSMTSLKPAGTFDYLHANKNGTSLSSSKSGLVKKNSTFVLDPKPPKNSLMNGCFSTTPESRSNFNTPKTLSRQGSSTSVKKYVNEVDLLLTPRTASMSSNDTTAINDYDTTNDKNPARKHAASFQVNVDDSDGDETMQI